MIETLIFAIILLVLNVVLTYKPIPIMGFPLGIFSLFIYITVFLNDASLPVQPFFTMFLMLLAVTQLLANAFEFRG